ncbi:transcription factor MYB101 [Euphorbia lathyris]|uniref:transcription factor MYB101 n=1 Tax=Euphorbia lathyris TaxID=212925 RepID=UPI003313A7C3
MEMEGGVSKCVNIQGLKKGPWTAAEDAILMEYVRKHGEGNWNSVQKNSGLMRCGKSCRLRWANHLRPNLKKGSFTPDEERIIIDLHAKLGNKWARMASQLPGRTDNEIKNFWNTRMKRRQRAGLPIYPQEFHEDQHQHQKHPNSPFSTLLSSRKPPYNPSLPFLDSITFSPQNHFHNSFYSNPTLQFKSFGGHHSNVSHLSPFNQNFPDQSIPRTPPLLHYNNNNVDLENNMSFTSLIMGDQTAFIPELPSNQNVGVCLQNETRQIEDNRSSGLLDTLLLESHHLLRKENMNHEDKGKRKVQDPSDQEDDDDEEQEEKQGCKRLKFSSTNSGIASASDDITSSQSSIGMKANEEPMEEMNSMDDDLLSLLDNFPSTTPLPEWYRTRNVSEGMSSGTTEVEAQHQQDDSPIRPPSTHETPNVEWGLGSSYWNNMPSIC